MIVHVHLDACASTQDEVLARLEDAAPGDVVAVSSDTQRDGRGRDGRRWQDPPGEAILVSVGRRGPMPTDVLDELPRRVADALLELLDAGALVRWKAPNDLVDAGGAKLAGILVDARTTGADVEHVVVGVGLNVGGASFETTDGRAATSLVAIGIEPITHAALIEAIAATIASPQRSTTSE